MRIVSLLPSATELIVEIGLGEQLVGRSHECDYPPSLQNLPVVTRSVVDKHATSAEIDAQVREHLGQHAALYSLDQPLLEELKPDLIVTQALCDVCAVSAAEVEVVAQTLPQVPEIVNLEPFYWRDVLAAATAIAAAAGVSEQGAQAVARLEENMAAIRKASACETPPSVALLDWTDPMFVSGHWMPELIEAAGGRPALTDESRPSWQVSWDELLEADPDFLFVACCGYDLGRVRADVAALAREPEWQSLRAAREGNVWLADGNHYFSRPGPRLVESAAMLAAALNGTPDQLPAHLAADLLHFPG